MEFSEQELIIAMYFDRTNMAFSRSDCPLVMFLCKTPCFEVFPQLIERRNQSQTESPNLLLAKDNVATLFGFGFFFFRACDQFYKTPCLL